MKRLALFLGPLCFLLVGCTAVGITAHTSATLTTPMTTETILPTSSVNHLCRSDETIEYSYDLLIQRELEYLSGNATCAQVEFPNGDTGVFVAIGFIGPTRGYQFLYRIENEQVELVEFVSGEWAWGFRSLQDFDRVDIEVLDLFAGTSNGPRQVLKVTGAGHAGTGLWEDGYFQIIKVTNEGIGVLFAGAEVEINANHQGWHRQYQYQYDDLDADGYSEIIKEGEECRYQASNPGLETTDCQKVKKVYYFNGTEYVVRE
jgi:hypothetical protein